MAVFFVYLPAMKQAARNPWRLMTNITSMACTSTYRYCTFTGISGNNKDVSWGSAIIYAETKAVYNFLILRALPMVYGKTILNQ
eukprot:Awhi_evm1s1780